MPPAAKVASISVELDFGPIVHIILVRLVLRKPENRETFLVILSDAGRTG